LMFWDTLSVPSDCLTLEDGNDRLSRNVVMDYVMTMETLASFHVFICSNLHIFVNCLVTYRVSACLTICHTSKVVPSGVTTMSFWLCTKVCKSQHFLHYKFWGVITRRHSGLNHSSGLRPPG